MKGVISMSIKELDKLEVMQKLAQKTINQEQASYILWLSVRQVGPFKLEVYKWSRQIYLNNL